MNGSVEVRLLGRDVVVATLSGEVAMTTSDDERWVLCALLLDGDLSKKAARDALGLSEEAFRQVVSRLGRKYPFLQITPVRGEGHTLDRTNLAIDALRLLELVEQARIAEPQARADTLRQARQLWRGGPPSFAPREPPARDTYLRIGTARHQSLTSGRRVLVVDDQIADALANALRVDHVCETAHSVEEFQSFEPRLQEFDLVVLDRHLQANYRDSAGDKIAERINRRADQVPVFMVTYRLPPEMDLLPWQLELGLAGAITKAKDGKRAYIDRIVDAVNRVFQDGPLERACLAIEQGMLDDRRKAEKVLNESVAEPALSRRLKNMREAADRVMTKAAANDLAGARLARDGFRRDHGLR